MFWAIIAFTLGNKSPHISYWVKLGPHKRGLFRKGNNSKAQQLCVQKSGSNVYLESGQCSSAVSGQSRLVQSSKRLEGHTLPSRPTWNE